MGYFFKLLKTTNSIFLAIFLITVFIFGFSNQTSTSANSIALSTVEQMNNELEQNNPLKMIDDSEVEDLKIKSEEELQKYALINNFELENYGYINDIEVKDDEVVFLATEIGLSIYNISDPEHPVLISKSFASINFDLIYLDNDTLFIAGYYSSDLLIIDISDLSNPIILSTIYYGTMRGYFVVEDNLYIGYFSKLNVYNIQNKSNPLLVKSLNFEVYFDYLLGYDNYLFFIDQDDIAHIIDISNRELPVVITTYDFPLTIDLAKISGDYLYATTGSTLFPFDIHNPLQIIAKVPINFSPANILNFIINGNIAFCYTSFQSGSIYLINLMNPEYPSVLYAHEGFYSTDTSSTVGIAMINSTLYLSLYSNGWISVDFLDLSLPVVIQHHYADTPLDFVIQDQLAFIEYYDLGFKIYNISNFLEPKFIGSFYHDNYRSHLVVNGNYSYFYVSTEGLVIYNITNLKDPTQIGQYNPLMSILEIHQKNDYLLLKGYTTIHFVNISDPTNPQLLGEPFEIGVSTIALSEIYNDLLFLAYYYHPSYYINVYNISSYDNVTFLSTIDFLSIPLDINVHNDTLYILDIYDTRTYSYNITDVYNPLENGLLVMNENYNGINSIIENDFYYIYNTFNTLISYKIETNGNLTIYGTMDLFEIDESHQIIEGTVTNSYPIYITSDYLVITGLDSDFDHLADYLEITVYGTNHLSNDSDNDLISDYYEIHYSLDPLNATDAGLDFDGDTLTNYQEYLINTDPNDPDTDGDLLRDDEELLYNTDPNDPDTDGEGLSDYDEIYLYFTDPLNPDSDSDGLNDNYEVVLSHTNPNNSDTDGDTMSDYYEVYNGLNPLLDDRFLDTDLDGINNYDEYLLGTKPNDSDSDNDGYTDLEEINAGTDPLDRDDYPEEILYSTITSPVSWYVFGPTAVVFLLLLFRKFTATKKSSNRRND